MQDECPITTTPLYSIRSNRVICKCAECVPWALFRSCHAGLKPMPRSLGDSIGSGTRTIQVSHAPNRESALCGRNWRGAVVSDTLRISLFRHRVGMRLLRQWLQCQKTGNCNSAQIPGSEAHVCELSVLSREMFHVNCRRWRWSVG